MEEELVWKKNIRNRLGGDAAIWYDIVEEEFKTVSEFERIFLTYYWGQQTQAKVRENLFNGKFYEAYGGSREKYAMRKHSVAKQLEPPMEEQDVILHIARHFEEEICDVVSIHEIRSIERLLNYLRRIDDAKQSRRRYDNVNPSKFRRYEGNRTGQNIRPEKQTYCEKRSYDNNTNNHTRNEDTRRDQQRTNQDYRRERNYYDRRSDQVQYNQGNGTNYRTRYMENDRRNYGNHEKRYENGQEKYNSNIRTSPGRKQEENRSPMRRNDRSPIRRSYRSPDRQEKTNTRGNDDKQNTRTHNKYMSERQVKFDEIAIVHDDPNDKQDF